MSELRTNFNLKKRLSQYVCCALCVVCGCVFKRECKIEKVDFTNWTSLLLLKLMKEITQIPSAQIYKAFYQNGITEKIKNDLGTNVYTSIQN